MVFTNIYSPHRIDQSAFECPKSKTDNILMAVVDKDIFSGRLLYSYISIYIYAYIHVLYNNGIISCVVTAGCKRRWCENNHRGTPIKNLHFDYGKK